jgi:hypothetical protein
MMYATLRLVVSAGLLAVLAMAPVACGGNLTSGGLSDVEVFVAGNDPGESGRTTATAAAPLVLPLQGPAPVEARAPGLQVAPGTILGTVTVVLQVELMGSDRRWVQITDGPQAVTVGLTGTNRSLLAARPLGAGRYIRARTTFLRVEAEVEQGLVVEGEEVTGTIPVELPLAGLRVEEGLFLELEEGDPGRLVVALNAQLWLRLVNANLRRVPQNFFQQAVRIRVF